MAVSFSLLAGAGWQFLDDSANPLTGGLLYVYQAGTTTPVTTYISSTGTVANSNPIVLDAAGRVSQQIWLDSAYSYKFVLKNSVGSTIWTKDNIPATSSGATSSALVGFIQSGTGAVSRTVQDRLRETISVKDFGAVGDGVTDDLAAFNAAIAAITNNAAFSPYVGGNTILIPQGTYYLSGRLNISKQIILTGVTTPDGNAWSGSILKFPTGTTGIRIYDYRTSPAGTDAGGTTIQNLTIRTTRSAAAQEAGFHGVHADTRFTIRNCVITYFGDCGINIVATAGGSPNGNANNWRIDNVRCAENGYDGLFVDGADTNAGVAIRLDCSSNLRWGIFDSSFLGNTYVGCHTASNVVGAYKADNANARNVFLGCYSESGQPASEFVAPTLVLGGIHAAGITSGSTHYALDDGYLRVRDGAAATPSMVFASDTDTGFYRTASGVTRYSSNGANKALFGTGSKFTTSGTYWSSGQAAHEFVQDSETIHSSIDYLTSTAYTGVGKYINCATAAGTGFNLITAANAGGQAFLVLGNGDVQNTNNSYGAISDIKLKQDISPAGSQWADIKAIQFKKYRFKTDPTGPLQLGVIAQELEQVSPGLIEEIADRDEKGELTGEATKTVKYSVLTMKAIKALQEAIDRIEVLESKVNKLTTK